jgi:hypothetical protein
VIHFVTENPTAQWARSSCSKPSRGIALRNICFGIAMRYMEKRSDGALRVWASKRRRSPTWRQL